MSTSLAALGLTDAATAEEVKLAYRTRARQLHPDAGGDPMEFQALNLIYTQALHEVTHRVCPTCGGTKKCTLQVGTSQMKLRCPDC